MKWKDMMGKRIRYVNVGHDPESPFHCDLGFDDGTSACIEIDPGDDETYEHLIILSIDDVEDRLNKEIEEEEREKRKSKSKS
jgi:hypothetical protein